MKVELGREYQDKISGLVGTAKGLSTSTTTGVKQVLLQFHSTPTEYESEWINIERVNFEWRPIAM